MWCRGLDELLFGRYRVSFGLVIPGTSLSVSHELTWLCISSFTVDWTPSCGEDSRTCTCPRFSPLSSTWSRVRFWPANIGEGRSFLGEVAIGIRLIGVPMAGNDGLACVAGGRHAFESLSPRICRPSLRGLNCTEVEFII